MSPGQQQLSGGNVFDEEGYSGAYISMLYYRRGIILISCLALGWNVFVICKNRQYVFTTLKLFMFVEIFYIIAMVVVLPHDPGITAGVAELQYDQHMNDNLNNTIHQMQDQKWQIILCSLESFINLTAYNISYFFGVLLTLNVRKVLDNTHRNFMKQNVRMVAVVCLIICLVYLVPLILSFLPKSVYSYGPAGFTLFSYWITGQKKFSLFYCGLCSRVSGQISGGLLSSLNMMIIPVLMFICHGYLLYINKKSMIGLQQLKEINPRHWFIIRTGALSFFLFIIQMINFIKFVCVQFDSIVFGGSDVFAAIIVVINVFFDWLPLTLVIVYYKRYYQKANMYRETRLSSNDASLITNQQFWAKLKQQSTL